MVDAGPEPTYEEKLRVSPLGVDHYELLHNVAFQKDLLYLLE